jgi:hypothetical protein
LYTQVPPTTGVSGIVEQGRTKENMLSHDTSTDSDTGASISTGTKTGAATAEVGTIDTGDTSQTTGEHNSGQHIKKGTDRSTHTVVVDNITDPKQFKRATDILKEVRQYNTLRNVKHVYIAFRAVELLYTLRQTRK